MAVTIFLIDGLAAMKNGEIYEFNFEKFNRKFEITDQEKGVLMEVHNKKKSSVAPMV